VTWTDDLTALPSRRALLTAHHQAFDAGEPTGLVLADLNGFKYINDTHGHPTGDHVLQVIATRMTTIWGPDVLVARLGGDEFAVLTTTPHGWPDAPKPPSTHSPPRSRPRPAPTNTTAADVLARADAAMYQTKPTPRPGQDTPTSRNRTHEKHPR
jgi:Diguanylate cyclase, GGDEF domain